jgi:hypothetical protein
MNSDSFIFEIQGLVNNIAQATNQQNDSIGKNFPIIKKNERKIITEMISYNINKTKENTSFSLNELRRAQKSLAKSSKSTFIIR